MVKKFLFRSKLKDMLDEFEISVDELQEYTGINKSTLYRYIDNSMKPSIENALIIADYIGCPVEELWSIYIRHF